MTRQGWCLVVLAVMAGVGCWNADGTVEVLKDGES